MAFALTDEDDTALCRYVRDVLEAYSRGEVSLNAAEGDLASAAVLAAVDDEAGFKRHIRLTAEERARA